MTPAFPKFLSKTFVEIASIVVITIALASCVCDPGGKEPIAKSSFFGNGKLFSKNCKSTSRTLTRSAKQCVVSSPSYGARASRSSSRSYEQPASASIAEPAATHEPSLEFDDVAITESLPMLKTVSPSTKTEMISAPPIEKKIVTDEINTGFKEEPGGKARRDIMVTAKGVDQIIMADDDNVTIQGSGGIVMISGRCIKLDLKASDTEVYCDIANKVTVSGNNNTVTLGTVGSGEVTGAKNKVSWESGFDGGTAPMIKSSGEGNTLKKRTN